MRDRRHEGGSRERQGTPRRTGSTRPSALTATQAEILDLQRTAGNTAVTRLVAQRDDGHATAAPAKATDLDADAQAIVTSAQDGKKAEDARAIQAVKDILATYYKDREALVSDVLWNHDEDGLRTQAYGKEKNFKATIFVGHYFITQTDQKHFARRVLQVGHELEHIQQHRDGMGGPKLHHEREFLAYYHEGIAPAVKGTGRLAHANRVDLLDGAVRHYNHFNDELKKKHADDYKDLLEKRKAEQKAAHQEPTEPPTDLAKD